MVEFQNIVVCGTLTKKGKLSTNKGYLIWFILSTTSYKFCTPETTNMICVASSNEAIEISHCNVGDYIVCTLEYESKFYNENEEKKYHNHFKALRVARTNEINNKFLEMLNKKKQESEDSIVISSDTSLLE